MLLVCVWILGFSINNLDFERKSLYLARANLARFMVYVLKSVVYLQGNKTSTNLNGFGYNDIINYWGRWFEST